MKEEFRKVAHLAAGAMGSPWAFMAALLIVLGWAVLGPVFGFSDTWQLVINTGTTIVTFLMVFLIQNTQNRDSLALHLKLDELLRALAEARTQLVDLEDLSDRELDALKLEFAQISKQNCLEAKTTQEDGSTRDESTTAR